MQLDDEEIGIIQKLQLTMIFYKVQLKNYIDNEVIQKKEKETQENLHKERPEHMVIEWQSLDYKARILCLWIYHHLQPTVDLQSNILGWKGKYVSFFPSMIRQLPVVVKNSRCWKFIAEIDTFLQKYWSYHKKKNTYWLFSDSVPNILLEIE